MTMTVDDQMKRIDEEKRASGGLSGAASRTGCLREAVVSDPPSVGLRRTTPGSSDLHRCGAASSTHSRIAIFLAEGHRRYDDRLSS